MKALVDQVLRAVDPDSPQNVTGASRIGGVRASLAQREAVATDCLGVIMPVLLEKGLVAPSPEGRGLTLGVCECESESESCKGYISVTTIVVIFPILLIAVLLSSYTTTTLASHMTIILIIAHFQLLNQPIQVLVKIVKANAAIRLVGTCGFLPKLVGVLTECMSAMEPQTLQYMSFHTARLNISEEDLEKQRLKMSQESPMQEALEGCLSSLERQQPLLAETVVVLTSQLSRGVGLATRASAAQSLSYLAEKYPTVLGEGGRAQQALEQVLNLLLSAYNMGATLRRSLTACLGALGKVVDSEVLHIHARRLVRTYNALDGGQYVKWVHD